MEKSTSFLPSLALVTSVSRMDVLQQRLATSPCLQRGGLPWTAYFNSSSAAAAFNQALDATKANQDTDWLIWAHQDVYLPSGWETQFQRALYEAQLLWPSLAVAGVYGVRGADKDIVRAGHVLDRGQLLKEPTSLPCQVDSIDELLVAVRTNTDLRMDPAMGFDFYATDLVLQAQEAQMCAAVLDAFCEHWSDTPAHGVMPSSLINRVKKNALAFEYKWEHRLPVTTPCFEIHKPGDVANFVNKISIAVP